MAESTAPRRVRRSGPPNVQCPGCGKLAGLDEPEVENIDVSSNGSSISVSAHIIRNSSCCGQEIKSADLEDTFEVTHECPNDDIIGRNVYHDGETFVIEDGFSDEVSGEDNLEAGVSGGSRYQASIVSVSGSLTTTCLACGEEVEVDVNLEIRAGDMDVSV